MFYALYSEIAIEVVVLGWNSRQRLLAFMAIKIKKKKTICKNMCFICCLFAYINVLYLHFGLLRTMIADSDPMHH